MKKPLERHIHDYEMIFTDDDNNDPLNFTLRCRCGDIAPNISTALIRTRNSRFPDGLPPWGVLFAIVGLISALVTIAFVVVSP